MVAATSATFEEDLDFVAQPEADAAQPNPIAALFRAMRARWLGVAALAAVLGPVFAIVGYFAGVQLYESQAILRVFPQESNILYSTGEASVLKTFDSFVKAETSFVASHPVMNRSAQDLLAMRPELEGLKGTDLAKSVQIKRSDSLIVLTTLSKDADFATQKLEAVIQSYLALKAEAEEVRTSVRLSELREREAELVGRLDALHADQLEIGGEFGLSALAKAHIEKIAQIEALASRKAEVAATLAALQNSTGKSSADTSDQEIMRATLLDRAMADLNFQRAKLLADLEGVQAEYAGRTNMRLERLVTAKLQEISVIEKAMADRREQIRVLGQTGALTDVTDQGNEVTVEEIQSLFDKVAAQLETARDEARDLNRRRIGLDRVENEVKEVVELLDETRRALEVISLEYGRALPGYAVVMSPPSNTAKPAKDTRKMLMAGGMLGGVMLALILGLLRAFTEKRIRFAETLVPVERRLPVLQVSRENEHDAHAADLLRNELQLKSLRKPRLVGMAPVLAVTGFAGYDTIDLARSLAQSFARARMNTLLIDADIAHAAEASKAEGWRDVLEGAGVMPRQADREGWLWELSAGVGSHANDRTVSAPMIRAAISQAARSYDVVVVSTGCIQGRLASKFVLSASDVGVVVVNPTDKRADVFQQIDSLEELPRNGSVAVLRNAWANDPWLVVQT